MATISVSEDELRKGAVAQPFSIFGNEVPIPIPFLDGHAYALTKRAVWSGWRGDPELVA